MSIITRHLIIHGRVQGVGYRAWLAEKCRNAHLSGWVRNKQDETVEALIHGLQNHVEAVIENAQKGPFFAKVDKIDINAQKHEENDFEGFQIRQTI